MCNKLLLFLLTPLLLLSQDYNRGLLCFLEKDYICAREQFGNIVNDDNNQNLLNLEYAHYYLFLSALNLYHHDTEYLYDDFITQFPFSNKKENAIFFMSEYFFEKKKYKEVVNLLSELNLYKLFGNKKSVAFFYLGYSAYKIENHELAQNSFYELIVDFNSLYREDAIFYNSYILYLQKKFELALDGFESLKTTQKYSKQVPYFISQTLFNLNKYDQLVNYLNSVLNDSELDYYEDLVLLQAQSLYQLHEYDPAIAYFEEYKELKGVLTRDQLYQIGIAYYKKGLYGFSINHLNKIIANEKDSIAQYAFYYLGDSYKRIENRTEAMNAFRSASLLNMDSLIQHDAFYQFVILCYENPSPLYGAHEYLLKFLNTYPNSEYVGEIYNCLANLHLNTRNYDEAINILEESNFIDQGVKEQYQKICFHKGVQLYNDGLYEDAVTYFNKSISVGEKNQLFYDAYYWQGESYYHLNMFQDALLSYEKVYQNNDFYRKSFYSRAYCYLKIKDYQNSILAFKKAINYNKEHTVLYDAYLRIADNYFSLMEYDSSIHYYTKALNLTGLEDDYATYQKSTAFVLLGDYSDAIASFTNLINNSPSSNYLDDAIFDLGNVYILSKNFDLAVNQFTTILRSFQNSLFYSSSKLKLGLVYYMQEKDNQAIEMLESVLVEFAGTNTAEEALVIIKNIYNEIGQTSKFIELIKDIDHDYTKSELDSSMYFSAELQYVQQNYDNAISSFSSYLEYYPKGLFSLESYYYLYKSYELSGDLENAISILTNIVNETENKYTVEGLLSLGNMSYQLEKYISSEMYFSKLLNMGSSINIRKDAIMGLLESKFNLYKYNEIINDISDLVKGELFSGKEQLRVCYLKAYSLYKLNKTKESLVEFQWLINNTDGELKAESYYYSAQLLYNDQNYKESQKNIFELINDLPTYQFWVQKSLVLLSKNYIMQEDMFQAQHVLNELEKKCNNEEILSDLRLVLSNYFPSKEDSIIDNK
tara:strand:+ start:10039 stop:13005 length:2967 start_codon:yes stop_codon:yes gene_type:complete